MSEWFYSCKGCVAPKRYPGCHDHCQEYQTQKAERDRVKAAYDREKEISMGIYGSRGDKVYKAMRDRRNKKI